MIILSVITVILAALLLLILILRTRGYDSPAWWLFRILCLFPMICFLYLAYDTGVEGLHLDDKYLFIRMGCLSLVVAMMLSWHLIKAEIKSTQDIDFKLRLNKIFKES